MVFHKDKETAWVITFTSFLVFLLSAVIAASLKGAPGNIPTPLALSNAALGRSFVSALALTVKNTATLGMLYGLQGILRWPGSDP